MLMTTDDGVAVDMTSAVCIGCGYTYTYCADYFARRDLAPPRRCRRCRGARRARVPVHGRLVATGPRFALLLGDDGTEYLLVGPVPPGLRAGMRCRFLAIAGERPAPGRRPIAYDALPA